MRHARHRRFFFACSSALIAGLLAAGPARPQSSALPEFSAASSSPKPDARKARKAFARGLRAEQAQDWPAAFEAYVEAARNAPGDTVPLLRREAARFQMVREHTDRAEREAVAGRLDQARDALRAALQLDPSYSVARERLAQFERPWAPPQEQELPSLASPARVQAQPGTRNFDYRGDVRGAYLEVARQFGLIVMFDNELPTRTVRFRVAGVDFDTAMNVLGQQTATFWRAVDPHTFFVAADTPQKRRDYAPVVVRTMVLPASATPDKMTETLRLVREIAGATHTQLDTRSHTLTLRDSPATVALAAALIRELEQAPAEILLEIEILEVSRDAARRLGITPPSTGRLITISPSDVQALQQAQTLASLIAIAQRVFGASVPPVIAIGGGRTIFLANLPGAAADFSETLNLVRSGRRMLLRAEDGQPATFFVGDRFPVALSLLAPSLVTAPAATGTTQQIFPRGDFNTGTDPVAIVTADFNGDKQLDLATANKGAKTISILLGNQDGTFGLKNDFATGTGPVALVTGDFNADGKTDLAIVNQTDNTVSILLGNGDGTFKPKTDFPVGAGPAGIVAGDFNGDGKTDLAIVNQTDNTVSILLGNGNGTFKPKTDFAVGANPVALATGDFNADGLLDLAVANQAANTVSILLGKGDGTFGTATNFSTGTTPSGIAVADFTGDNRLDLAVANQGSSTVSILVGVGDGTFGFRTDIPTGQGPSALVAADFNRDARIDLAVANQTSNSVTVILNSIQLFASSSIPQTAYPGAEYEDLGLKVRATPRIHDANEVTLHLEFSIRSLSGAAINGIPVISNRTVEQTVRLRANETSLLWGLLDEEETRAITGLPGFA